MLIKRMADIVKEFDEAMLNIYRTAKARCRYNASHFLQMLHRYGELATAKQLLATDGAGSLGGGKRGGAQPLGHAGAGFRSARGLALQE